MMPKSKKDNARLFPEVDPPRRVRQCLDNGADKQIQDKSGNSYLENVIIHDHDYIESLVSDKKHQREVIAEFDIGSQIKIFNTDTKNKLENESKNLSLLETNFRQKIVNDINCINQNSFPTFEKSSTTRIIGDFKKHQPNNSVQSLIVQKNLSIIENNETTSNLFIDEKLSKKKYYLSKNTLERRKCTELDQTLGPSSPSLNVFDYENESSINTEKFGALLEAFTPSKAKSATVKGLHNLQNSLSKCPDENEFADDPFGLTVPLMMHQKKALKWLSFREDVSLCSGGILADDMGLGKTLTMIALIISTFSKEKLNSVQEAIENDIDSDEEFWRLPSNFVSVPDRSFGKNICDGGTLVVCPATLLDQWKNEVQRRTVRGLVKVKIHHGSDRLKTLKDLRNYDIIITTYQLLHQDLSILNKIKWKRVVLDEAHYIRNPKTSISKAACELKAEKRWAMTGTPVHNKPLDIYALIKFLGHSPWDDLIVWNKTMRGTKAGILRLSAVLRSLVLCRTKKDLQESGEMPPLPARIIKTIYIELDEAETNVYTTLLKFSQTLFAEFLLQAELREGSHTYKFDPFIHKVIRDKDVNQLSKTKISKEIFDEISKTFLNSNCDVQQYHILVLLLRLRQICNHPTLVYKMIKREEIAQQGTADDNESKKTRNLIKGILDPPKRYGSEETSENSQNPLSPNNPIFNETYESSKIKLILKTVREIIPTGDKIVIVSQWTTMLEVIEWHLSESGETRSEMFSGQIKVNNRQDIIERFNDPKSDLKILLLSLTAGGVGLNLCGGNHLLMVDNHWNPQLEKQAEDRIYRFGQQKEVFIYKFLCQDTIEQKVIELQEKKLRLSRDILQGIKLTSTKLSLQDLQHLFNMR